MARVAIVSLRCNPAFVQFLIAYAKAFRELGHEPSFLLDSGYRRFSELQGAAPLCELPERPDAGPWTHAIFLNAAVENRQVAAGFRKDGAKVLYVYHEPWQRLSAYLRMEGISMTARVVVARHATLPVLKLADTIMLASRYGLTLYEKRDVRFNRSAVAFPLIMDDEAPEDISELLPRKQYFGFIGNPCRSHGFDQYLSFMRTSLERGRDIRFLIASRFPLPSSLTRTSLFRQNAEKIELRCGRPLNNVEMNVCYAESFAVWSLYRRSTQSAVLPRAFMFGTPVVASEVGSFPEYVRDGENGRFARAADGDAIVTALEDIRSNLAVYAANCRKTFRENFYYRSQLRELDKLL